MNIRMNPQGTQLVFRRRDKHLQVHDIPKTELWQVTTSDVDDIAAAGSHHSGGEWNPAFSPDGQYIAFGTSSIWNAEVEFGSIETLVIVANDRKTHHLADKDDKAIILPRGDEGKTINVTVA